MDELCPIGVPVSWHEGRLIGKGTLGRKSVNATDHATLSKAHLTVLQQSALVAPYMEEYMQMVRSMQVAIFSNFIEEIMEVFMDDFSVHGTSFTWRKFLKDVERLILCLTGRSVISW